LLDTLPLGTVLDLHQRLRGGDCTVLLYHSVASGENNPYFGGEEFAAHMDLLASEFRVVGADEYLWHLSPEKRFARRSVMVTFDDGFENNYTVVQPIMEERRLPWVLFTTTQALDQPDKYLWFAGLRAVCLHTDENQLELLGERWDLGQSADRLVVYSQVNEHVRRYPAAEAIQAVCDWTATRWNCVPQEYARSFCSMITAEQLYELDQSPLIEIGAHTHSHPFLTRVADDKLHLEIDEPSATLARLLGHRIRMFAYPAGAYGQRETDRVANLGFDCAFAVAPAMVRAPRYEIPRIGIFDPSLAVVRAKALGVATLMRSLGINRV
jgi:peptidoglycan/xylan/chitin deacetylase (PgdA/CDA1 family)